jgi:hypothetical protein
MISGRDVRTVPFLYLLQHRASASGLVQFQYRYGVHNSNAREKLGTENLRAMLIHW